MVFGRKRKDDKKSGESAALIRLTEENERLQGAVAQLSLLNELAQAVGMSESSETMIRAIVKRAKRALNAEQVMIYLSVHRGDEDVYNTVIRQQTRSVKRSFHFDEALGAMMEVHKTPFVTNDPHNERRMQNVAMDPDLRSLLCVPLMVRGKLTGIVVACNKRHAEGFGEEDKRIFAIMANQSAQVLENTRLREEEEAYERLQHDVQMARDIQRGLLPKASPEVAGYDIAGCSIPAELVGGDYFDFIPLAGDRMAVCLGDVSGKGIPASLLMANLQATLRGQAHVSGSPLDCVVWSNRLLYRSTAPEKSSATAQPPHHRWS